MANQILGQNAIDNPRDYTKEYNELFFRSGINPANFNPEWGKRGDRVKEFSLLDNEQTPILTSFTIPR